MYNKLSLPTWAIKIGSPLQTLSILSCGPNDSLIICARQTALMRLDQIIAMKDAFKVV